MKQNNPYRRIAAWAVSGVAALLMAAPSPAQSGFSLTKSGGIVINDNSAATPYPSVIGVSNLVGTIEKVTVTLSGVTHNYPDDIDVLLIAPGGERVMLMSDAGGDEDLEGVTLNFDDAASRNLPDFNQITPGDYRPTNHPNNGEDSTDFDSTQIFSTSLSTFNGLSANGDWDLYIRDDQVIDGGNIASWTLTLFLTPTLTLTNEVEMDEDGSATVEITVADSDTPLDDVTITASSSNTDLVDEDGLVVSGTGEDRTLVITPKADASGTAIITVTADDGLAEVTSEITLTVNPVNDAPTIAVSTNRVVIAQGSLSAAVEVELADVDTDPSTLVLTADSSNPEIVEGEDVAFSGTGTDRTLVISPRGAATGTAVLTVNVVDNSGEEPLTSSTDIEVVIESVAHGVFAAADTIEIPDGEIADPYGSTLEVEGITGLIGELQVDLANVNHPNPEDLAVLLVGPDGQSVVLMRGAGGAAPMDQARLIFDADAAPLPDDTHSGTGVYGTADYGTGDFPTPAPAAPYGASLDVFDNTDPNGTWTLFVQDTVAGGGSGSIDGGFILHIFPAPTIADIEDQTTPEDTPESISFAVDDFDGSVTNLTVDVSDSGLLSASVSLNGSTGTVVLTPVLNQTGTATVTITAFDDSGFTAVEIFQFTIEPVNDRPVMDFIPKQITRAGEPLGPISFGVGDVETAPADLSVTATSDNPKLLPNSNIVVGGSGDTRTLTLFPAGVQAGEANITVSVSDGGLTTNQVFTLTVNAPANPLFENSTPITINDDTTATPYPSTITVDGLVGDVAEVRVTLFSITHPSPDDIDALLVGPTGQQIILMSDAGGSADASSVQLVLAEAADEPLPDEGPLVSGIFDPADYEPGDTFPSSPGGAVATSLSAFNGTDPNGEWRLFVVDDSAVERGGIINGGWQLSIQTMPSLVAIPSPQRTDEDIPKRVTITIGDNQPGVALEVTATPDNAALIENIEISGTGSTRTLNIIPAEDQHGTTTITVSVSDGTTTDTGSFEFIIDPVNDSPSISGIADVEVPAATATGPIAFTIGDPETADADELEVEASSSNQTLIPNSNLELGGSGVNRTIDILPTGVETGTSTITVTVTDPTGLKTSESFVVTVTDNLAFANTTPIAINDFAAATPYPSSINVRNVEGVISRVSVTLVGFSHVFPDDTDVLLVGPNGEHVMLMSDAGGGGPGQEAEDVRLTFRQNDPDMLPNDVGPIQSGTYQPSNYDGAGSDTMPSPAPAGPYGDTLEVFNGDSPNGEWKLFARDDTFSDAGEISGGWILLIETAPTIATTTSNVTAEDTPYVLRVTVADADTPAEDLVLTAEAIENDPANLVVADNVEVEGEGSSRTVTITPTENLSGTNLIRLAVSDGESTTIATVPFEVTAVDDPPVITTLTNRVITLEDIPITIEYTIGDVDSEIGLSNVVVISTNPALVPNEEENLVLSEDGDTITLVATPAPNQVGSTVLRMTLTDRNTVATNDVTLEVTPVNDLPVISGLEDQTVIAGTSTELLEFTVEDVETPARSLVVTPASDNQDLVPDENIMLGGSGETRTIQVTTIGTTPGTATISVTVTDGDDSSTETFTVTATEPPGAVFANTSPIDIQDNDTADPYPSTINVSGQRGGVFRLEVVLDGLEHSAPDDVDVLLVGPAGQEVVLLSDTGGANPVSNTRLVFATDAARVLEDDAPITSGTYQASDYEPGADVFPSPAPGAPYSSALDAFTGTDPNGVWSLYVVDDRAGDDGQIAFGWSLRVETAPTITMVDPVSGAEVWPEDSTGTIVFNIDDMVTPLDNLQILFDSSNPTLLPPGNIDVTRVDNTVTAILNSAPDAFGTNNLTITVRRPTDGASTSVVVPNSVTAVNDLPTISRLTQKSTEEDVPLTFELLVEDVDTPRAELWIEGTSANTTVISHTNILFQGRTNLLKGLPENPLSVTLRPNTDETGSAEITFTVTDLAVDPAETVSSTFTFIVTDFNDPPTISSIEDKALPAGSSSTNISFTVGDPENGTITITATSSDETLVRDVNIVVDQPSGPPGSRTVRITTEPGVEGAATITLTATDSGGKTATTTFTVDVRPTRDRVFANAAPIQIRDNGSGDPYPSQIEVTGFVGDIAKVVVDLHGFAHRFPDDVDMLLVSPAGEKVVLMSDAGGGTTVTNIDLTFDQNAEAAIPDATLASGDYRPANYDGAADAFLAPAPAGPYDNSSLSVLNGDQPNGTWSLYVMDDTPSDAGVITDGWSLTITTKPSIENLADVTTAEDTTARVTFTIAEEEFASTDFTFEATSSNTSLVPNDNIEVIGEGLSRTVLVTPAADQSGSAEITIELTNPDGQVVTDTFVATFTPVNDEPTITSVPDQTINAGGTTPEISFTFGDIETDKNNLVVDVDSSNPDVIPVENILLVGNVLRIVTEGSQTGSSQVTITITDEEGATASTSFLVTVLPPRNPLFANTQEIVINDNTTASPYPSSIEVTGVQGEVMDVTVTLSGLSHFFPDDVDMLLVGPGGQSVVLMSDAGAGGTEATSLTEARVTFDDAAEQPVPDNSGIGMIATYRPANYEGSETFPSPAPAGSYGSELNVFEGTDPNGTWSLYVMDDASPDGGSIVNGWLLNIVTTAPTIEPIDDQELAEDTPVTINFTVADGDTAAEDLEVTASVDESPVVDLEVTGTGAERSLIISPVANRTGSDVVTVQVTDGTLTNEISFNVTVSPVNDAPEITGLADASTPANVPLSLPFTVSDVETDAAELTVEASLADGTAGTVAVEGEGAERTLVFTPSGEFPASASVTVTVSDGELSGSVTINIDVTEPLGPSITEISDAAIPEDSSLQVPFTVSSPAEAFTVEAAASNPELIASVEIGGDDENRTALVTLVPNAHGSSTITITVTDEFGTATEMFELTVTSVEDAPVFGVIPDQTTPEDGDVELQLPVSDIDTALEELAFSAITSNPGLVEGVDFTVVEDRVMAVINLVPDQNGIAAVTFNVSDGVNTASRAFALTVVPVADVPDVADIEDQTIIEDSALSIELGIADPDTPLSQVQITGTASNEALVDEISFTRDAESVVLNLRLVPNATGTSDISIRVSDGGITVEESFTLTVEPGDNDAPVLGEIPDQTTGEGQPVTVIFTVEDPDTDLSEIQFTGSSSDTELVTGITFEAVDGNVAATVNVAESANGTATITITALEGDNAVSQSFELTVTPVDTAPVLAEIAAQTVNEDATLRVALEVSDPDTAVSELEFSGTAEDTSLVSGISFTVDGEQATAVVDLVPDASGSTTVTITVTDGNSAASSAFVLNVTPVSDTPDVADIADQTITENTALSLELDISDPDTPLEDLQITASASNEALVDEISFTRDAESVVLNVSLVPDATGTSRISVRVSDGGITVGESFTLTVEEGEPEPEAPVLTAGIEGGNFIIGVTGEPGETLVIEATSDFQTWVQVGTVIIGEDGSASLEVPLDSEHRFFRAVTSSSAPIASAVYEGFDYPADASMSTNFAGGRGFSASWAPGSEDSQGMVILDPSLGYSDDAGRTLATSGNRFFLSGAEGTVQIFRNLEATYGAADATTWISLLAVRSGPTTNNTATPDNPYPRAANFAFFLDNSERFAVGSASGMASNAWTVVRQGSAANIVPENQSGVPMQELALIVIRIDHIGDGTVNDNLYMWVNPELGAEPSIETADATDLNRADYGFNRIRPFAGGPDANNARPYAEIAFDEIRVGDSWESVTPSTAPAE